MPPPRSSRLQSTNDGCLGGQPLGIRRESSRSENVADVGEIPALGSDIRDILRPGRRQIDPLRGE
ncbi:hypothetical protein GCM10009775_05020 [Microbacterium aoyamense]|uniref:Uncharacterized protein n=1 Tax=Microbacterium aoyamense TaxID=344166 RepID=A0ABN2PBG9_9MICO